MRYRTMKHRTMNCRIVGMGILLSCMIAMSSVTFAADYSAKETIVAVQDALNDAGYPCGTADGIAGQKTRNAISQFRTDKGLPAGTGIDEELLKALGLADEATDNEEESSKETKLTQEEAKRAIVVCFSNDYAEDVWNSDGSDYDPAKFHSYESGSKYMAKVTDEGTWRRKSDSMHVEDMTLTTWIGSTIQIDSADVSRDGDKVVIANIEGTDPSGNSLSDMKPGSWADALVNLDVSLLDYDANDEASSAGSASNTTTISDDSDLYDEKMNARKIFDLYGEIIFPESYKSHWLIDLRDEEHTADGDWYFKVGATVKVEGQKYDLIVSGTVDPDTAAIPDYDFSLKY